MDRVSYEAKADTVSVRGSGHAGSDRLQGAADLREHPRKPV